MEWLLRMIFSAFSRVFPLQTAVFPFFEYPYPGLPLHLKEV